MSVDTAALRRRLATKAAKVRRAQLVAQAAAAERDELILAASEAGIPARQIAEVVGLSHPAVLKILKRPATVLVEG